MALLCCFAMPSHEARTSSQSAFKKPVGVQVCDVMLVLQLGHGTTKKLVEKIGQAFLP
jgi:hypothetical protein